MALNFNQYAAEGKLFLKDYSKFMNMKKEPEKAGRIFISIMYALSLIHI